ncbi:unnamed protein product, partial [Ectocarpus sp. 12 AP-2014]
HRGRRERLQRKQWGSDRRQRGCRKQRGEAGRPAASFFGPSRGRRRRRRDGWWRRRNRERRAGRLVAAPVVRVVRLLQSTAITAATYR